MGVELEVGNIVDFVLESIVILKGLDRVGISVFATVSLVVESPVIEIYSEVNTFELKLSLRDENCLEVVKSPVNVDDLSLDIRLDLDCSIVELSIGNETGW